MTSLRTNVEVLLASPDLDAGDRALLEDVLEQSEELSSLVADLIEVARGELPSDSLEDVRLDKLVEEALVRARRNAPNTHYSDRLEPVVVQGSPERAGPGGQTTCSTTPPSTATARSRWSSTPAA